jgi:hypothetical protein
LRPGGEHRPFQHLAAHQSQRRGAHELKLEDGGIADAGNLAQQLFRGVQGLGEGAEAHDQRLVAIGLVSRLGAARNRISSSSS